MKKSINKLVVLMILILVFLLSFSFMFQQSFNLTNSYNNTIPQSNNIRASVDPDTLNEEVESFEISINLKDQTLSYDVTFKTNEFDGSEVHSFYYMRAHEDEFGNLEFWNAFEEFPFKFSTSIVKDKHASNTASYMEIYDMDRTWIMSLSETVRVNVEFEKDGEPELVSAHSFQFYLFDNIPATVDDDSAVLDVNEEKTYGQFHYSFDTNERTSISSIYLKSHSDENLNQKIYSYDDKNNFLWQGEGVIPFQFLENYHYYDLYVEYIFNDLDEGVYTWESDILNNLDFQSGIIETGWSTWAIVLLILFILLIILAIIFIVLIVKQIQKRRELEKQQDQAYYDENYEDGMN